MLGYCEKELFLNDNWSGYCKLVYVFEIDISIRMIDYEGTFWI